MGRTSVGLETWLKSTVVLVSTLWFSSFVWTLGSTLAAMLCFHGGQRVFDIEWFYLSVSCQ